MSYHRVGALWDDCDPPDSSLARGSGTVGPNGKCYPPGAVMQISPARMVARPWPRPTPRAGMDPNAQIVGASHDAATRVVLAKQNVQRAAVSVMRQQQGGAPLSAQEQIDLKKQQDSLPGGLLPGIPTDPGVLPPIGSDGKVVPPPVDPNAPPPPGQPPPDVPFSLFGLSTTTLLLGAAGLGAAGYLVFGRKKPAALVSNPRRRR